MKMVSRFEKPPMNDDSEDDGEDMGKARIFSKEEAAEMRRAVAEAERKAGIVREPEPPRPPKKLVRAKKLTPEDEVRLRDEEAAKNAALNYVETDPRMMGRIFSKEEAAEMRRAVAEAIAEEKKKKNK